MSCSNNIKSLLDIQDPNIIVDEDCVKEGTYKGKRCKYIFGNLTYTPTQRSGQNIVDEMLNYDPVLKANYELYQEIMESMENKDFEALSSCLTNAVPSAISNYIRTSLKTLRKHLPFIENSFIYPDNPILTLRNIYENLIGLKVFCLFLCNSQVQY